MLCEIFEQRSSRQREIFKYNPRKCNSASSFSGCVHGDKSKCCIVLPTDAEHVRVFEKPCCVNIRLAFETEILINNKKNLHRLKKIFTSCLIIVISELTVEIVVS